MDREISDACVNLSQNIVVEGTSDFLFKTCVNDDYVGTEKRFVALLVASQMFSVRPLDPDDIWDCFDDKSRMGMDRQITLQLEMISQLTSWIKGPMASFSEQVALPLDRACVLIQAAVRRKIINTNFRRQIPSIHEKGATQQVARVIQSFQRVLKSFQRAQYEGID